MKKNTKRRKTKLPNETGYLDVVQPTHKLDEKRKHKLSGETFLNYLHRKSEDQVTKLKPHQHRPSSLP